MRWLWWAPLGVLLLGCAGVGLRLGYIAATITETDVINTYAAQYVEGQKGARLTDCHAVLAEKHAGTWIIVSCRAPGGAWPGHDFFVNQWGSLVHRQEVGVGEPVPNLLEPET